MAVTVRRGGMRPWAMVLLGTLGLVGSMFMAEIILAHRNWRIDLTPSKRFTLAPHSRTLLQGLQQDVEIVAFLRSDDARNAEIEDLLRRVGNAQPRVRYSVIDVNRNPAVARQYGVGNYGSVVVESGGRRKVFASPREDLLMQAIMQVTRPSPKVVYFLTGHGEQDIENTDRRRGYSAVRTVLHDEFYDVRLLHLLGESGVPQDASVVVIAGPRKDLLTEELLQLHAYVERGGHLLIMLDPQMAPGLGAFLDRYGVKVGNDVVVDPENRLFAGDYLTMTASGLSDRHPVSAELQAAPLFSQARSVHYVGTGAPDIRGIDFLHTAPTSWATADLTVLRTGVASFDNGRDQPGPVSVGVSVLVARPSAVPVPMPDWSAAARFIILGDSDFANNFFIEYLGDKDLLANAVNWLAGEEELVSSRPQLRIPGVNQFYVSAGQGRLAFILGTVVEPALFLMVGAAVFLRRRWKG
jgi:ABC-type uncharacterized transport system involved in gliding motility auxiliary subunit